MGNPVSNSTALTGYVKLPSPMAYKGLVKQGDKYYHKAVWNGLTYIYPTQPAKNNASVGFTATTLADGKEYSSVRNLTGATVIGTNGKDDIELKNCSGCTVDVSQIDKSHESVVFTYDFESKELYKNIKRQENKVITLSDKYNIDDPYGVSIWGIK